MIILAVPVADVPGGLWDGVGGGELRG